MIIHFKSYLLSVLIIFATVKWVSITFFQFVVFASVTSSKAIKYLCSPHLTITRTFSCASGFRSLPGGDLKEPHMHRSRDSMSMCLYC